MFPYGSEEERVGHRMVVFLEGILVIGWAYVRRIASRRLCMFG